GCQFPPECNWSGGNGNHSPRAGLGQLRRTGQSGHSYKETCRPQGIKLDALRGGASARGYALLILLVSKCHLHVRMKNKASAANRERNGRVADGRVVEIKELVVHADDFILQGEPVRSDPSVIWIAKLAEHGGSSGIELETLGYQH